MKTTTSYLSVLEGNERSFVRKEHRSKEMDFELAKSHQDASCHPRSGWTITVAQWLDSREFIRHSKEHHSFDALDPTRPAFAIEGPVRRRPDGYRLCFRLVRCECSRDPLDYASDSLLLPSRLFIFIFIF